MRDFFNPALLLFVVALLMGGAIVEDAEMAQELNLLALVISATLMIVDFSLGLAGALARRPSIAKVGWGVGFLLVGSCAFLMPREEPLGEDPAMQEYNAMLAAYRQTGDATAANEVGDTLLVVAASVGQKKVVEELLAGAPEKAGVARAIQRAAENGHLPVVKLLLPKVAVNEVVDGGTPLVAAVAAGRHKVAQYLLENGADPDLKDESGTPPLVHAVIAESAPCVQLLLKHGADAKAVDATGRDAASFSRSEKIDSLLGL